MKKTVLFLSLFLSSCSPQDFTPIDVLLSPCAQVTLEGGTHYQAWNCKDQLSVLIEKKASFPLFVFVPGCGTCETYTLEIDDYLRQNPIVLPYVTSGYFRDITGRSIETSSLLLYKEGREIDRIDMTEEDVTEYLSKRLRPTSVSAVNACTYSSKPYTSSYLSYTFSEAAPEGEYVLDSRFDRNLQQTVLFVSMDRLSSFQELDLSSLEEKGVDLYLFDGKTDAIVFKERYGVDTSLLTQTSYALVSYPDVAIRTSDSLGDLL